MSVKPEVALADCLARMGRGETLAECLARYPEQAAELRELLLLAGDVRQVPAPRARPEAKAAGQQRMMAAAARSRTPETRHNPLTRLWASLTPRPALRWPAAVLTVLAVLVAGGWLSVAASAGSLPGDLLYPVKRASERVQMWLTIDDAAEKQLEAEFAQERLDETKQILVQGRQAVVEFEGELGKRTAEYWLVGGLAVELSAESRIEGEPVVGAWVQVRAESRGDGRLLALGLRVGRSPWLAPTATTTPRPSPTCTATPTITPVPTRTPLPTLSPTRPPTRTPSAALQPGPSPQATGLLPVRPTRTRSPAFTPPTRTPEPSPTPLTRTPEPSSAPPTRTPDPNAARPSRTPGPTLHPSSTAESGPGATRTRPPRSSRTPNP